MKWKQSGESSGGTISKDTLRPTEVEILTKQQDYIKETKSLLQTIKKTTSWADGVELDRLDTIIMLAKENIAIKQEILELIGTALKDSTL